MNENYHNLSELREEIKSMPRNTLHALISEIREQGKIPHCSKFYMTAIQILVDERNSNDNV